ncbi:MAG TPA: hypothetical protein VNU92_17615 [Edaphobacter sp.]|jgi:hypothetical protein|nr:hypothetical protein [Edaphobacter sp.]
MRRIFAPLLILATAVSFGQTSAQATPGDIIFHLPASATGCPVGFNASRRGGLQALTASDEKRLSPGQGLHLTFDRLAHPAIQSITVMVYATAPDARILKLQASSAKVITKNFTFERQSGASTLSEADVWMQQVGSIGSAVLTDITFTDGTTWHPTQDLKCVAVPSLYLPVDAVATR